MLTPSQPSIHIRNLERVAGSMQGNVCKRIQCFLAQPDICATEAYDV